MILFFSPLGSIYKPFFSFKDMEVARSAMWADRGDNIQPTGVWETSTCKTFCLLAPSFMCVCVCFSKKFIHSLINLCIFWYKVVDLVSAWSWRTNLFYSDCTWVGGCAGEDTMSSLLWRRDKHCSASLQASLLLQVGILTYGFHGELS